MSIRKPSTRRALILGILVLLVALPALGQRGKKGKKTFSETTSVVAVEVPVAVTRGGEPVTGLTAENFEIYDGRKQQVITDFQVIDLSKIESHDPLEHRVPVAARRHFLMFFDMAFSLPTAIVKAREAANDLVDNLHPSDLAGVATYSSTTGANLLLNFTSDRNQLKLAIDTLGVPGLVERAADPLSLVFGDLSAPGGVSEGGSRTADEVQEVVRERLLDVVGRVASAELTSQINKVSAFTGNMEALAHLMASLEGRKHLVYFSEGIPDDVIGDVGFGDGTESSLDSLVSGATSTTPGASTISTETSATGRGSFARGQLESMIEQFRRAGCVIQAVDIGGVRALNEIGGRQAGEQSLVAMSKDTGGEFFRNFNDLGVAMDKMLERNSVTYLLVFQPQDLKIDGEYHRLKVKLVNAPRGTRLSHRSGFYAPASYGDLSAGQRQLETAEIIMSDEDGGDLEAAVLAAAFPVKGEEAYVPLLVEIGGSALLAAGGEGTLPLELYAYATDQNGSIHDLFTQSLGLDLARTGAALEQSGLKFWGHFDLPPGGYTARVLVRDQRNGRFAMRHQPFAVPAFDDAGALLLPPMVPEPPGKWLLVREAESRRREVDYPFMADGNAYIPAVRPVVPARGSTPLYLQAINLTGEVAFAGEVVDADGEPVPGATLKLPAAAGPRVTAELVTKGLAPGEYVLVSTATDGTGAAHSSSLRFVVR